MPALFDIDFTCAPALHLMRGDTFIETGTQAGESFEVALLLPFRKVYTVEVDRANYDRCVQRFQNRITMRWHPEFGCQRKGQIFFGSSPEVLPNLLKPEEKTVLWLDAHYVGNERREMDEKYGECALMAELAAITRVPWKERPVLLIDDAACFRGDFWRRREVNANFTPATWPTIGEVLLALEGHGYTMKIIGDIIWLW
mgnify:CR=1 FL=1